VFITLKKEPFKLKIFHTADWHLGKLIQNVYMTEDQAYIINQFLQQVEQEKPDVIIIAGDLYDRMIPPTEAVELLDRTLAHIVLKLQIPVLAIAGNHDSPGRLHFGSRIMTEAGLHLVGELSTTIHPVKLKDDDGEVHFYLIPFADPSKVRHLFADDTIQSHDDAMRAIMTQIQTTKDPNARHVIVGHAFVTPHGEKEENTSDSEKPLSIGGAEYVNAAHFSDIHYVALGHLHQAHHVGNERIRYSGSPLKYSISEENHNKGYLMVEIDGAGEIQVSHKPLQPRRNMRTVKGYIADIEKQVRDEDYIYVRLLDEQTVLAPMERVRAVYPNAMHVMRESSSVEMNQTSGYVENRAKMDPITLFKHFYSEMTDQEAAEDTVQLFVDTLDVVNRKEGDAQ
jgi:exonuclease SbcD